jgi:hypothetical protein
MREFILTIGFWLAFILTSYTFVAISKLYVLLSQVFTAFTTKNMVMWAVILYSLERIQCFRGIYQLHLTGTRSQQKYEDGKYEKCSIFFTVYMFTVVRGNR